MHWLITWWHDLKITCLGKNLASSGVTFMGTSRGSARLMSCSACRSSWLCQAVPGRETHPRTTSLWLVAQGAGVPTACQRVKEGPLQSPFWLEPHGWIAHSPLRLPGPGRRAWIATLLCPWRKMVPCKDSRLTWRALTAVVWNGWVVRVLIYQSSHIFIWSLCPPGLEENLSNHPENFIYFSTL